MIIQSLFGVSVNILKIVNIQNNTGCKEKTSLFGIRNIKPIKEVKRMRKLATMFIILVSFGLLFAGAVSAQEPATVDVAVTDENGVPVDVTCVGDEVVLEANASSETTLPDPAVIITVDPETGLAFDDANAVMIFNGITYANDPNDPFFYPSEMFPGSWTWWIGWVDDMDPNDFAQLYVPALVTDIGEITVTGDLYIWPEQVEDPIFVTSDDYTFLSVPCHCHGPCASGATVPMQNTGTPLAALALGMLSIIGGAVYGKLR
jgi:hypothetical protein